MNTPRTKRRRRFNLEHWRQAFWGKLEKSGHFGLALANQDAAIQFALLVTEFTHLEHWMARFLGRLMQTDDETAAHVLSSIVSAKARIDLMRNVLERARHNSEKPEAFDEIINEYERLNRMRNILVHARYQTNSQTCEVKWIPPKGDPYLLDTAAYEPFDIDTISRTRRQITDLFIRVTRELALDMERTKPPEG